MMEKWLQAMKYFEDEKVRIECLFDMYKLADLADQNVCLKDKEHAQSLLEFVSKSTENLKMHREYLMMKQLIRSC